MKLAKSSTTSSLLLRYVPVFAIVALILLLWYLSTATRSSSRPVGGVDFTKMREVEEIRRREGLDKKLLQSQQQQHQVVAVQDHNQNQPVEDNTNQHAEKHRPHVKLVTAIGSITFQLLPQAAPETVKNFIKLVEAGFFSKKENSPSASFYRAEMNDKNPQYDFCLQGGGWPVKSSPFGQVKHEYNADFPNKKYAVSMARTSDPDSATSEFSIMLTDNSKWLGPGGSEKYGYAVFAQVVDGIDLIEKFRAMKKRKQGGLTYLEKRVEFIDAKVFYE